MKTHLLTIISLGGLLSCNNNTLNQSITISNNSQKDRTDEAFIIKREKFNETKDLLPIIIDSNGNYIASQVDDINLDGNWDELAFVYSLKAGEKATLNIKFISPDEYPKFDKRTHVRLGKLFTKGDIRILNSDSHGKYDLPRGKDINNPYPYQTDGPAWENDKMAFRHYFDGRNVRDVFGKTTNLMVMDNVGIQEDGYVGDTYHILDWWGRDIMSGARSFGLGGIAMKKGDSLIRLGVTVDETINNIDSTHYTLISDGVVRSIFKLDFIGWDVDGEKIDVSETMTIWAGKFGYENNIKLSNLPDDAILVTGIVNNFNDMPYIKKETGNYSLMMTHDKQTYDKVWYMGMGLMIDKDNCTGVEFEAPKEGDGICTTWCTELKPNSNGEYNFNCCAAWEITDSRFVKRDFFESVVTDYADELSEKSIIIFSE